MFNQSYMQETLKDLLSQKESILLAQIGQLITDGVLVVQEGEPYFFRDSTSDKILYKQSIKILSKESEVIDALKAENAKLKDQLELIKRALK